MYFVSSFAKIKQTNKIKTKRRKEKSLVRNIYKKSASSFFDRASFDGLGSRPPPPPTGRPPAWGSRPTGGSGSLRNFSHRSFSRDGRVLQRSGSRPKRWDPAWGSRPTGGSGLPRDVFFKQSGVTTPHRRAFRLGVTTHWWKRLAWPSPSTVWGHDPTARKADGGHDPPATTRGFFWNQFRSVFRNELQHVAHQVRHFQGPF